MHGRSYACIGEEATPLAGTLLTVSARLLAPAALVAVVGATLVLVLASLSDESMSRVTTAARTAPEPGELLDPTGAPLGAALPEDVAAQLVPGPGRGDRTVSIVASAQQAAAAALGDRRGAIAAIDVRTGDVLVLTGDHPTRRTVAVGAALDVLLVAAGIDAQAITAESTLNAPTGAVSVQEALAEPVPAAFASLQTLLGPDRVLEAWQRAGGGERVPLRGLAGKLRARRSPVPQSLTDPATGTPVELRTQLRAPVLALAMLGAAVATDGKAPRPDLEPGGGARSAGKYFSAASAKTLRPLLRSVVTNGAGRSLRSKQVETAGWVSAAGKTATAVAYAPADDPQWAVAAAVRGSGAGALAVSTLEALAG